MRDILKVIEEVNNTPIENASKMEELANEFGDLVMQKVTLKRKYQPLTATQAVRDILQHISVIPDEIKQMFWVKQLALHYDIPEKLLTEELGKIKAKKRKYEERKIKVDRKK